MKTLLFLFCLSLAFLPSLSAQQFSGTFPYELVGGKMVVTVEVNGSPRRVIFDTGAFNCSFSREVARALGMQDTLRQVVTDVNNNRSEYRMAVLDRLAFPGTPLVFRGFRALVTDTNPFECFGADGLIGSELLSRAILVIDGETRTVTITSAEQSPRASLRVSRGFMKAGVMPVIETTWNGEVVPALFDTGYGGFLLIRNEDYGEHAASLRVVAEGVVEGSFGLSGKSADEHTYRVAVDNFGVNTARFTGVVAETSSAPYSLVGMKLLDFGKVTIDYPRQRFYFEPRERENELEAPLNDFGLKVDEGGDLVVTSVWNTETSGIKAGDRVLKINGNPVKKYDFCESITTGIPELQRKAKNVLEVETADGIKNVIYRYNKKKDKKR